MLVITALLALATKTLSPNLLYIQLGETMCCRPESMCYVYSMYTKSLIYIDSQFGGGTYEVLYFINFLKQLLDKFIIYLRPNFFIIQWKKPL